MNAIEAKVDALAVEIAAASRRAARWQLAFWIALAAAITGWLR